MSGRGHATPGVDGLLIVDKPAGCTSHDVVGRVRRLYGQRRVGHAGTLDPAAVGVLVVALGRATRLLEYLGGLDKAYEGIAVLGAATDSDDDDGTVLATVDASHLTAADVEAGLTPLRGAQLQRPPAVSAKKVDGRTAYSLARSGQAPDLAAAPVVIHALELLTFEPGPLASAHLRVVCGSGTYIRAIARDLGQALGVGGHLRGLARTRVGPFPRQQAVSLDELQALATKERLARLLPVATAVAHLPAVTLTAAEAEDVRHGRAVVRPAQEPAIALFGPDGELLAVGGASDDGLAIRPRKVLVGGEPID